MSLHEDLGGRESGLVLLMDLVVSGCFGCQQYSMLDMDWRVVVPTLLSGSEAAEVDAADASHDPCEATSLRPYRLKQFAASWWTLSLSNSLTDLLPPATKRNKKINKQRGMESTKTNQWQNKQMRHKLIATTTGKGEAHKNQINGG